jgi:hypothetical protein
MNYVQNLAADVLGISTPEVGLVPAGAVPVLWERVVEVLQDKGQKWLKVVDENDIYRLLVSGQADLWCAMHNGTLDGVMICMMERHARASYYHVCFIGGKHFDKYIARGLERLEKYACIMGAAEIVLEGRKGLARKLRPYGYFTNTIRLRKPVNVLWRN